MKKNSKTTLFGIYADVIIAVHSNDLIAVDKSIHSCVGLIRYEFETRHFDMDTKNNKSFKNFKSFLYYALQLMRFSGEIPIGISDSQIRNSEQSTG